MQPPHEPDAPLGDGDFADVAARLHASLTGPSLDGWTRQRHLHAIRSRAAAVGAPSPAPQTAAGVLRRLASSATAGALVMVMGASGAVAASHDTLPGQALYPVKQATEQVVLAAPLPTGHLVDRHLSFADRRLSEAAALADRDADAALVAGALADHIGLLARAGELAGEEPRLAARVDAAATVAHRRIARLLDEGLPAVAAGRARAALSAVEARLDRSPATPPPAPTAAPPPEPAPPVHRPTPTLRPTSAPTSAPPATRPQRTPAPTPRPAPAPPTEPGAPQQRPEPEPRQPRPSGPAPPTLAPQHAPFGTAERDDPQRDGQAPHGGDRAAAGQARPPTAQPPTGSPR